MIISASRRTDIPSNYADWFFNRVAEGYVLVRNPMNFKQVRKICLAPEAVDCFVFWTKYPVNFSERLKLLSDYSYYFQFTLTPYGNDIEMGLPDKTLIIEAFKKLSSIMGPARIIWRYDPVLISERLSIQYHLNSFYELCKSLSSYTSKCIISFYDDYRCARTRCKPLMLREASNEDKERLASGMADIARDYGIRLETCAESSDLSICGVFPGKCIDDRLIKRVFGIEVATTRDQGQRKFCGCVKSIDIGSYSTCTNKCLYCYASKSFAKADEKFCNHDYLSPILCDSLNDNAIIRVYS